ncbi:MAG: metal ABC transporter solute-binding protein, Zn/Mn family, partial [Planctomycetota bacterium]
MREARGFFTLLALFLVSCGSKGPAGDGGSLQVFVSILPQAYLVERIGGEHVEVHVLVAPGASPATYEPSPKELAKLGAAARYFRIGVPFERGFITKLKSTHEHLEIVDTREGVDLLPMEEEHDHGEEEEDHEGEALDPHIWLDPILLKTQAETIFKALREADPAHGE